jgi:hypothetical protein
LLAVVGLALALAPGLAYAAGLFPNLPIVGQGSFSTGTGTVPAGPPGVTGAELIPADTGVQPGGVNPVTGAVVPATVSIPSSVLGAYTNNPRNLLDNGALQINQRGTAAATTCGTTSGIAQTAYASDRWGCVANVGSGAGQAQVVTSSPTPPAGFGNVMKVWRNSGSLGQPVCVMQAVPSADVVYAVNTGKPIVFSFQAAALAGLLADNGNLIFAAIFTGTGTDQGLGSSFTASPAITPAWTNIATPVNQTFSITTTFTRYSTTPFTPATNVTEIAAALCFTPNTATSGGATDGFAFTGAQLESSGSPSPFEFKSAQVELAKAQRFFYSLAEPTDGRGVGGMGNAASTSTCQTIINFPVPMRAAPTFNAYGTALGGSTWKINSAASSTVLATTFYVTTTNNSTTNAYGTWTVSGTPLTAGNACYPIGANGGSILGWSADL